MNSADLRFLRMKATKAIVAAVAMMSTINTATTPPMMATVLELSELLRVAIGGSGVVADTSPSVVAGPTGATKSNIIAIALIQE